MGSDARDLRDVTAIPDEGVMAVKDCIIQIDSRHNGTGRRSIQYTILILVRGVHGAVSYKVHTDEGDIGTTCIGVSINSMPVSDYRITLPVVGDGL
jgi:hypothetical protein